MAGSAPAQRGRAARRRQAQLQLTTRALSHGIATVDQDLAVVSLMEVWRHFFLGSELTSCWGPLAGLKVRETKRIADEELVERTGATHVGVELDASHLFWQRMDPVAVVQDLGPLTFHAAAKDVKINPAAAVYGVLDNRFRRLSPEEPRTNLGGDEWANEWPKDAAWDFVALGRGHDAVYWSTWLSALYAVDPDMWVNIEHEDVSLGRIEGLEIAAGVLLDAAHRAGVAAGS